MTSSRSSRMLRLALTPKWLLALLGLVLLMIAAALLGRWQWERTQTILTAERAAAAAPAPIDELFPDRSPGEVPEELPTPAIGHPVTLVGSYDPDLQAVVTSRSLADEPGVWVVTGMPQPDGTVVAVVRGWLPSEDAPGVTPADEVVSVTGVLHPDERFYADAPVQPDRTVVIASDRLAEMWGVPVLPGFVVLESQEPGDVAAPSPVPPTIQTSDVSFPLQNFFYAIQWWIFAAFGAAVYLRWLWIEAGRDESEPTADQQSVAK